MRFHAAAIKYFDAVRRAGSIRGGARELNVASSAVNRQIQKLEDEFGALLFERLSSGLVLTQAGELFARHVTTVLQDAHRFEDEMAQFKGGRRGEINVVMVEGLAHAFLPAIIAEMRESHPHVHFSVLTTKSHVIPDLLDEGDSDVGIAFALAANPAIQQLAANQFRVGALMLPDHPLAQKFQELPLVDALDYPWIMGDENLSILPLIEPTLRDLGRMLPRIVNTNSFELMKKLTLGGLGISFQTVFGFEDELAAGRLVHIPVHHNGPVSRDLSVQIRKGRALTASIRAFINIAIRDLDRRARRDQDR